ncbi:glycerate kinase [Desulfovibrio litoralis]|uniref:Glycerate kinase n=1 Tax=Desulfovibrio litoralis DSM 11393 TaxID=1121455 RepID=A0A1M7TD23_9BACT|nr:glycerate kinase [Desulfovibrio litoralis]SHN68603.1 glycerate kinase [Desulfovibrio litoralis DSM 11393]
MRKVILIPDSFKGTMSSCEICSIMEQAIHRHLPGVKVVSIPVADGGEGSVDCFLSAVGGIKQNVKVKDPYFKEIDSFYGLLPDGTAIVEMAACAGLPLVENNKSATKTTTYGVGQLIAHAAQAGCKRIIIGLGGSATNDGGTGAAAALGVKFKNSKGESFVPVGGTLKDIVHIDVSGLLPKLKEIELVAMCDIDNPLCGIHGAAHVFGPQKGADPETVKLLDAGLLNLAKVVKVDLGKDICDLAGAGAAGGMGGGMVAFLGAKLQMGIETILDTVGFDELLKDADLVFSGEGKIDFQSLRGKVVIGVARRTKKAGVPLIAVVGDIGDNIEAAYNEGISGIFSINRVAVPFDESKNRSKDDLRLTIDNIIRFIQSLKK